MYKQSIGKWRSESKWKRYKQRGVREGSAGEGRKKGNSKGQRGEKASVQKRDIHSARKE